MALLTKFKILAANGATEFQGLTYKRANKRWQCKVQGFLAALLRDGVSSVGGKQKAAT